MAYDKITTEYMVHKTGEPWFLTVNSDGTQAEQVAECARLSPNGVAVVKALPVRHPKVGTVSISGTTNIETGAASELSCVISGDATDLVYRWSTGCQSIAIVGPKTNMTVQVSGTSATTAGGGNCWLLCTVTSASAIDGSGTGEVSMTVTDPPEPAKTVVNTVKK